MGRRGTVVGVDLELIEPRTDAFVREWFTPEEQALVVAARRLGRSDEVACLLWSAKEAAAKVLRAGLRLDPRGGVVTLDIAETGTRWQPSTVDWKTEDRVIAGWWRIEGPLVITIAADPGSTVLTELA